MHRLVDADANGLVLLGLGNSDAQDAVLEVGTHSILVDASWEVESA